MNNLPHDNEAESVLYAEIYEQPDALRRVIAQSLPDVDALVTEIRRRGIAHVVLAARGTSDNAAVYARYLLEITVGVPVGLAAPSVHTMYDATIRYNANTLVVGVSQSGAGEDINTVVEQARKSGALTLAITNTPDSPLARASEHRLLCHAGIEHAVAATKSYTTTLALFALLAARWADNADLQQRLEDTIPALAEQTLAATDAPTHQLAQTLMHAERMLTVARGLHFATAIEAALKIAETSYTTTQAFSSADLLHGPIASVDARTPCLLFLPAGRTHAMMEEVAERLQSVGARVLRFGANTRGDVNNVLLLADAETELLSPIVDILPAQLLAFHLTRARGLNPDNPRGLSKVTITR